MSIHNPSIFQGEQSFGTTPGAPLSTDVNNQLVSGITHSEVSATASITAGTGADTLMTGMTLTPVAGTYLAVFSCDIDCATTGAVTSVSIYVGGTQKADSLRKVAPFDGGALSATSARCGVSTNGYVTVNGSQAIEIRWSASTGTNTAAARTLNLLRVV